MDKEIIELVKNKINGNEVFTTGANNYKLWLDMYRDEAPWLGPETLSLNLSSTISSELARLTTIEMKSEIEKQDDLNKDYQKVVDDARRFVEYGLALGGVILKPYVSKDRITVDYVTPDLFIPINFNNFGEIDRIVFIDETQVGDSFFRRIEEHNLTSGVYEINNACFESDSYNELGDEVELSKVDRWSELLESAVLENVDKPLYSYFRNPQANNLDLTSPMGVSCYSRATSLIQDADEQYSRIIWEFEGSELAIDADLTVLNAKGGLPAGRERLFRNLGIDQKDGFYEVFSPAIRDSSLFNGLNQILKRIEYVCGLAVGTISDPAEADKTATEIKASKQRSYSTVTDIQKSLQQSLEGLVEAMIIYGNIYLKRPITEPSISFEFDDSIIVDTGTEQAIRMQEVAAGLTKPESYLMWRYGVSEEEARKMLPSVDEPEGPDDEEIE